MKKRLETSNAIALMVGIYAFFACGLMETMAQQPETADTEIKASESDRETDGSEYVTINVKDANISEVLKAYSLQTGQSIVVGPDVVSENVNVRLNNIPWQEALDVILKPYGFGYRVVGDTIVISKLENIVTVEGIEPLASKVFNLKYLDAYDIKEVCEAQLSSRGKFTILSTKGLPGWEFGGAGSGGAATQEGIRRRKDQEQIQKSKTFVITDVPASLTTLTGIIEEMDQIPIQVLIESRFLEINSGGLTDIGMDYLGAIENVQELSLEGSSGSSSLQPTPLGALDKVLNMTTGFPDPLRTRAAGGLSQATGLRLSHAEIGDTGMELLFSLIANDDDANILSAPRVLTLNNQEAAILVGEKYPIVSSAVSSAGGSQTQSESLDYYENIGIQLNVIPQVCDGEYVNMIVHPAVSELSDKGTIGANTYPRLNIREAETQVLIRSGNTAIIGGLQKEKDTDFVQKIPFLGDIPFLGRLFRRERTTREKIDLLIFIKASIIVADDYAAESIEKLQATEALMRPDQNQQTIDDADAEVELEDSGAEFELEDWTVEETAAAVPVIEEESDLDQSVENEEILALVKSMDEPTTNTTVNAEM